MNTVLNDEGLDLLFREARTHSAWLNRPVADETLRQLYDLMKWAPTSANCNPARIVFLRTKEAKERLLPALAPGNVEKVISAPVTAIVARRPMRIVLIFVGPYVSFYSACRSRGPYTD